MKSLKTALVVATALPMFCAAGLASAQSVDRPGSDSYRHWRAVGAPPYAHHAADGGYRCRGISYGTGAQSCGTASGGPVGGLSSKN